LTATRIRVPVPAETNGEDRLVGSLTFRHAAYLAVAAAGVAVMLLGDGSIVRVSVGAVIAFVGIAGAVCRPYGEPLDRLLVAATAYLLRVCAKHVGGECAGPVDDHPAVKHEEPRAVPPEPAEAPEHRPRINPNVVRRVLVAVAVGGVAAIATTRLMDRPAAPPPEPRVVVVPVPVSPQDPWQEVDSALQEWLDSLG
jgi:hypothetical protein